MLLKKEADRIISHSDTYRLLCLELYCFPGRVIETKRGEEELWESDRDNERCRGVMRE